MFGEGFTYAFKNPQLLTVKLKPRDFIRRQKEKNSSLRRVSRSLTISSDAYTRIESAECRCLKCYFQAICEKLPKKAVHGRQFTFRVHTASNSPLRTQRKWVISFFVLNKAEKKR